MKIFALAFAAILIPVGCHCQIPPSPPNHVALTWTLSTSCTTASPCPSTVVSRASVATSSTPCPSTGASNYTQIGTTGSNATSYTDTTLAAAGAGYYCWIVQAQQNGQTSAPSAASNNGVALLVPQPPLAPGMPGATTTTSALDVPETFDKKPIETASISASAGVKARLVR